MRDGSWGLCSKVMLCVDHELTFRTLLNDKKRFFNDPFVTTDDCFKIVIEIIEVFYLRFFRL